MTTITSASATSLEASARSTGGHSGAVRAGVVVTALVTLFLGFDRVIHLLNVPAVQRATAELGQPSYFATTIGCIEAVCLALYLIPRTALWALCS